MNALLIDSDLDHREKIERSLATLDSAYQVDTAVPGSDALRKILERTYDLVLDHGLSHDERLEIVRQVRRKQHPTQIILMVKPGEEGKAAQAIQEGTCDFLLPEDGTDPNALLLTIKQAHERCRLLSHRRQLETALESRDRWLTTLGQVATALSQSADIGEALSNALGACLRALGAEAGGVYIIDEETNEPAVLVHQGFTLEFTRRAARLRALEETAREAVASKTRFLARSSSETTTGGQGHTVASILLETHDQVWGALNLLLPGKHHFSPGEKELLGVIAGQMATAIAAAHLRQENYLATNQRQANDTALKEFSRLLEKSQAELAEQRAILRRAGTEVDRRERGLSTLSAIARSVSQSTEVKQVVEAALNTALQMAGAEVGAVVIVEDEASPLLLSAQRGLSDNFAQVLAGRKLEHGSLVSTILSGQTLVVNGGAPASVSADVKNALGKEGIRSLISVPLRSGGRVLGAMIVATRRDEALNAKDARWLSVVGQQVGIAVENAHLREEVWRTAEQWLNALEGMGRETVSAPPSTAAPDAISEHPADIEYPPAAIAEAEREIRRQNMELRTLMAIAETVSGTLNLEEMLDSAVREVAAVMEVDTCWIYLHDEAGRGLLLRAQYGLSESNLRPLIRIQPGEGPVGAVVATNEPVLKEELDYYDWRGTFAFEREGLRSFAGVPMRVKNELVGVLGVASRLPRQFDPHEVRLLTSISHQVAIAVDNAKLYYQAKSLANKYERGHQALQEINNLLLESQAELERQMEAVRNAESEIHQRNRQLAALNAIAATASQSLDFDKVSRDVLDKVLETLNLSYGEIFLFRQESQEMVLVVRQGESPQFAFAIAEFGPGEGIPGLIAQNRQPLVINDVGADPRFIRGLEREDEKYALASIPLIAQEHLVGAMNFFSTDRERFTPQVVDLLTTIGHQIGVALANARLYEEVKVTAEQLRKANEELQQLNRLKSDFIATVSHELRTPLASIMGYVDLMRDEETGTLNEEQAQYMEVVERNVDRLSRLINDILDISRIEAGHVDLAMAPLDVEEAVRDAALTLQPQLQAKGIELEIALGKGLPMTMADPDRIKQVLVNLLSNAIKYTPENGRVTIQSRLLKAGEALPAPAPPLSPDSDWLLVSIADTGIGLPSGELDRVFEKFYQVGGVTDRPAAGSGLGLSIAQGIMEAHNGAIWAESAGPDQGATFTIALPVSELVPVPTVELPSPSSGEALVLVVDDEVDIVNLMRLYLEADGYHVIAAHDGETAIRMAAEFHPSVITLDLLMPNPDGFVVLEQLKTDPTTQDIPVLIVSILANKEQGFSLGAVDYLTKPIDRERLVRSVRNLIVPSGPTDAPPSVLVVDDDKELAGLVKIYLESEGYRTTCAYNGWQAVECVAETIPDLIILDILMPQMDGFQVIQALKATPHTRHIPVIILTAKDLSEREQKSLQLGTTKYLTKTLFSKKRLLEEVRDVIAQLTEKQRGKP